LAAGENGLGGRLLVLEGAMNGPRLVGAHLGLTDVALSPDGRLAATGTHNGHHVKVWEVATGRLVRDLPGRTARVAFSPDGRWLVSSTNGEYCFYEVGAWEVGHRRANGGPCQTPLAFSHDGRLLAVTHAHRSIKLLDAATLQDLATLAAVNPDLIRRLWLSPDGSWLAAATNGGALQLWDLRAVRRQLEPLGLDWEQPAFASAPDPSKLPLKVHVQSE
jgi:WD40 repeat protein